MEDDNAQLVELADVIRDAVGVQKHGVSACALMMVLVDLLRTAPAADRLMIADALFAQARGELVESLSARISDDA